MLEEKNVKLIKICNASEGVNKKGDPWRKVVAVFETNDHYPRTIACTCFNSVCETVTRFTPGALLNVTLEVESRSWTNDKGEEKWFTDAIAKTIVPAVAKANDFDTPLPPLNEDPNAPQGDLLF